MSSQKQNCILIVIGYSWTVINYSYEFLPENILQYLWVINDLNGSLNVDISQKKKLHKSVILAFLRWK